MAVDKAPAPGVSPDFDKAWEGVIADGGTLPDNARDLLWKNMVEYGAIKDTDTSEPEPETRIVPQDSAPRVLSVPAPADEPYWWDDPQQAQITDHFIISRRELGHRFEGGLLITGPSGSGKSQGVVHAVARVSAALGVPLRLTKMDCATVTDPQKWFGRREVDETGTHYVRSDFVEAVERGDVILLDEITRLHPHLQNPVMALLDGSNAVNLSDLNVTVHRHPHTVFLATANIGAQHSGAHGMDWAMRERFPTTLERPWPPRADEIRIVTSRTNCDDDAAANMVDIARETRKQFAAGDLRSAISTRILIHAGGWVASGMNEQEALEITAVALYDPDANGIAGQESERQQVRRVVEGKFRR